MSRRIITTENLEEDIKIENNLRPQLLDDYIGQEKIKEMLKVYIAAAKTEAMRWIMCFSMDHPVLEKRRLPVLLPTKCM